MLNLVLWCPFNSRAEFYMTFASNQDYQFCFSMNHDSVVSYKQIEGEKYQIKFNFGFSSMLALLLFTLSCQLGPIHTSFSKFNCDFALNSNLKVPFNLTNQSGFIRT